MARVTITITDLDEEAGTFALATEFDPPIPKGLKTDEYDEKLTNAQRMGCYAIGSVTTAVESTGGKATFGGPTN